ncbi:hypothetical protein CQW39_30665 [Streptomyces griseofuscus]|nr:hypothetical protein CQW39_30665 [Streptomyces griseofuscus]
MGPRAVVSGSPVSLAARWAFVLGDVCGKGPEAATLTALARHTLRATAQIDRLDWKTGAPGPGMHAGSIAPQACPPRMRLA